MKEINLGFEIKSLEGAVIESAGKLVANILLSDTKDSDPIKLYDWAIKLGSGESIKIDGSDFTKLRTLIFNHPNIFVVAKAPIIKYLDSIKEE